MKEITSKGEFDNILKENKLVAVDFTAIWCGPCKMIGPKFVAMATEFPNVYCVKVDVDKNEDLVNEYGVGCMPTFMFFKDGRKVGELKGADEAKLREEMRKLSA